MSSRGAPLIHLGMTEADVEWHVKRWCKDLGLDAWHDAISHGKRPGWPDWAILGPNGALFRELKGARGRVSAAQDACIDAMARAGLDAAVWWPQALVDGSAFAELRAISRLAARTT